MANFLELISFRWIQQSAFANLCRLLTDYGMAANALWITASETASALNPPDALADWLLLITPSQRALLLKQQQPTAISDDQVSIGLSFDAEAIAAFLNWLENELNYDAIDPMLAAQLTQAQQWLMASPPTTEEFVLALVNTMAMGQAQSAETVPISASTSSSLPLSIPPSSSSSTRPLSPGSPGLAQQVKQRLLLDQVISQIRQSLALPEILQTTVNEVRQFLNTDRLAIYQFKHQFETALDEQSAWDIDDALSALNIVPHLGSGLSSPGRQMPLRHHGCITYEARIHETLPSILHYAEDECFIQRFRPDAGEPLGDRAPSFRDTPSRQSRPKVINDVAQAYQGSPCLLQMLTQAQVQSKLVVSIWVGDRVWGLLIAHQCTHKRQWQPWEVDFLQHIGEHLSVAIRQAELYHQLQQQKRSLEVCVIERTQDLRDAMIAAQSASRAKSEFLATMSHELRTPLTCIIGMSATLLRWSFGDLSPRQQDYLTTIHDSGERLLTLINDILEVSKIESGRTILEVSEFSLSSLARQCLDVFQDKAQRQGIDLGLDLRCSTQQDSFVADPRRIKQILQNLLSNAIKFTPEGGEVTLRLWRENQAAVFRIEDTGIGIPEAQQALLFEKFQQLETTRHRQYQGTGLGLALTKQLVELHSGSISVESKVNYGSAFTVRLPIQSISAEDSPLLQLEETAPEPISGRIVLVEDQEETAGIICDMLTAADYQVIWVIDGSQVVEQVELLQPMAVIIDMGLSGTNGYDIVKALRQRIATASVKILTLANDSQASDMGPNGSPHADNPNFTADEIINKPIDPEALLIKINGLMSLSVS